MTIKYISNRAGEWLIAKYPYSGYEIKELANV
jgi:hypothetical protein